ncbi:MAG: glycosyltransferase family protein, partial [Burkholderiales bacterium]|nr:glycosyltransferase family protein [Burkholderiales bacterium]
MTELSIPQAMRLAVALHNDGRLDEASALYREVLRASPGHADALHLLGLAHHQHGNHDGAVALIEQALALDRGNGLYWANLGHVHRQAGRPHDARRCYGEALDAGAGAAAVRNGLGWALAELERHEEAEAQLRAALALDPALAEAHNNLGNVLLAQGRLAQAAGCYRSAVGIDPAFAVAHANLGNALRELGDPGGAIEHCRRALALDAGLHSAHNNLGSALADLGEPEAAERSYRAALALRPNDAATRFNQGLLSLMQGDYAAGWPAYELRFAAADARAAGGAQALAAQLAGVARWGGPGDEAHGLVLWTEQGLGDNRMMLRYLALARQSIAQELIVYCRPELSRLIQAMGVADRVIPSDQPLPWGRFDRHSPLMSLPLVFGTRLENIPATVPYLTVPEDMRRAWAKRVAALPRPRVGLAWAGGRALRPDALRSMACERFEPLLRAGTASFVSLQQGQASSASPLLHDWMQDCRDLLDTAALISQLDLVVSVDTAVAHLAGALATPVWLLNRHSSEWRWMREREDSPWYPVMRIFRQSRPGDWDEVIARVAQALSS